MFTTEKNIQQDLETEKNDLASGGEEKREDNEDTNN